MNAIDDDTRRLVVEAGFAAVNHGLSACATQVLEALPWLVPLPLPRAQSRALLLFGLGRRDEAFALLDSTDDIAARDLRRLLASAANAGTGRG
ncbi:EscG/YscG/SsaH family type III secretion system needle protein co-chaperone [Paludibacterium yongneupense]|uniref:EscG/YscG/SsaH family type III secretion system needle protein co-chaperone n=1 Tax=Paludibacterium yongneupense TaxID=400061 RepID=UPI0004120824|nr:EscG/YscG/SsaH family type III secretion system needle protein co-chaperone [Paludibacterium yongneupense]